MEWRLDRLRIQSFSKWRLLKFNRIYFYGNGNVTKLRAILNIGGVFITLKNEILAENV